MDTLTIRKTPTTLTSKTLQRETKLMMGISEKIRTASLEACAIVARVDRMKSYEKDGFKSVHEWTEQFFGIRKTTSYAMLKIGQDYLTECVDETGKKTGWRPVLNPHSDTDYSVSQLGVLLPVPLETAKQAAEDGEITAGMSVRELKAWAAEHKPERQGKKTKESAIDTETEVGADTETETETETTERPYHTLFDMAGRMYAIPDDLYNEVLRYLVKKGDE